ncbi:MAG: Fe-S cluster assembly ATPase SufC [Acidimicrobiales bacterium]|nr:Fe-S cluster assembly ATPase SufC [Acidimicrobiales bacterium]
MLHIEGLCAKISGKEVLKGLDLDVKKGSIVAIMGPNGSGKSTLANVLSGKPGYEITAGKIEFNGQDITDMSPTKRGQAGLFVASQYPLEIPGVTPIELMSAACQDLPSEELMRRVELVNKELSMPDSLMERGVNVDLSGGERKRIEILQLLALKKTMAILDELDSGLDVDALELLASMVAKASKDTGMTVLAVTHYSRLLEVLIPTEVHVLVGGTIVRSGGPELAVELESTGYKEFEKL